MLKIKNLKLNFLEWNCNIFISSIKNIDPSIILIMILDAIFYALSAFAFIIWSRQITAKMQSIILPSPASMASFGLEKVVADAGEAFQLIHRRDNHPVQSGTLQNQYDPLDIVAIAGKM